MNPSRPPAPARRFLSGFLCALVAARCLSPASASAELLWYGDPDKGRAVFNNVNLEGAVRHSPGSGSVSPAVDAVYGKIWRVHKPAADKRAEIRGATGFSNHGGKGGTIQVGGTYYLGWRYKFHMPDKKMGGWACFQWKSYPDPHGDGVNAQEYPILMGYDGRRLSLTKYGSDWKTQRSQIVNLWSKPVAIDTWVDIVLVIKLSREKTVGYIEFYFNGDKQELLTGGTRVYHNTMDAFEVSPKWGAYNKNAIGTEITVDIADLRIGTDLESVMPKRATP